MDRQQQRLNNRQLPMDNRIDHPVNIRRKPNMATTTSINSFWIPANLQTRMTITNHGERTNQQTTTNGHSTANPTGYHHWEANLGVQWLMAVLERFPTLARGTILGPYV
jgi:P pilus assembly chaperone PapD